MASKKKPAKDAAAKPAVAKPPVAKPAAKPAAKAPAKQAPPKKPAAAPKPPAEKALEKAPEKAAEKAPAKKAPAAAPAKAVAPKPAPKKPAPAAPPKRPTKAIAASLDDIDGPDEDDLEEDDEEEEEDEAEPAEAQAEDGAEEAKPAAAAVAVAEAEEGEAPPKPKRAPKPLPPLPPRMAGVITVAVSGDADDAFMIYALKHEKVDTQGRKYEFAQTDIAVLNEESKKGTYDVTAFSFGAWPAVGERYTVLPCGGSFGDHVGPVLVSKTPVRSNEVDGMVVAVPGLSTTATMVLRLWLPRGRLKLLAVPFDKIGAAVKGGMARAGLLIHEGQLTYRTEGLARVVDLGLWWGERTEGLPLPLGGTAVRRDISPEERAGIALDMKRSIAYAMGHREEALAYAAQFSRGLAKPLLDKYVSMYVNELTLDYGERGKQAVQALYDEALRAGLLKERLELDFI